MGGQNIRSLLTIYDESGNAYREREPIMGPQSWEKSDENRLAMYNNRYTPLGPSERREAHDAMENRSHWGRLPKEPGRYRFVFEWEGCLNPDDWDEITRYKAEKWVEVTK